MHEDLRQEMERRYRVAEFNARNFSFWVAIHDYAELIRSTDVTKTIIKKDEEKYYDAFATINEAFRHLPLKEREKPHGIEVNKLESLSLFCHFLNLEMIFDAIHEMANKHELHLGGIKCNCPEHHPKLLAELAEEAVNYERELNEIRRGKFSKRNLLLQQASGFYRSFRFVHNQLLNVLSAAIPEPIQVAEDIAPSEPPPLQFNSEAGILIVEGLTVKIRSRGPKSKTHKILEAIFKNIEDSHPFSFLYEDLLGDDYSSSEKNWRICYRACQYINARVAKDTNHQITDFLTFTSYKSGEVRITPKYLHKTPS